MLIKEYFTSYNDIVLTLMLNLFNLFCGGNIYLENTYTHTSMWYEKMNLKNTLISCPLMDNNWRDFDILVLLVCSRAFCDTNYHVSTLISGVMDDASYHLFHPLFVSSSQSFFLFVLTSTDGFCNPIPTTSEAYLAYNWSEKYPPAICVLTCNCYEHILDSV